jgi:hypothetical protein
MIETSRSTIPKQSERASARVRQAVLEAGKHHWALRVQAGDVGRLYGRREGREAHHEIEILTACYHPSLYSLEACTKHPAEAFHDMRDIHMAEHFGPALAAVIPGAADAAHCSGWVALTYTVAEVEAAA